MKSNMSDEIVVSKKQLTDWAESLLHVNHHGTLIQSSIVCGDLERAKHLSERTRKRAWEMLNEMFEIGAEKPEGYKEPKRK